MKRLVLIAIMVIWGPLSAHSTSVNLGASGSFLDQAVANPRDIFTITNTSAPGVQINSVTIDFDPASLFIDTEAASGFPFTVDSGGLETGFNGVTGAVTGSTSLNLAFTAFDAGETFTFFVDIDDGSSNGIVEGSEFAGVTLQVTFVGSLIPDTPLSAAYQATGPFEATAQIQSEIAAVPEPATVSLVVGGLLLLLGFRVAVRHKSR